MNALTATVRRHPLGAFFVLTYCISWGVWIPMVLAHERVIQGHGLPTHFAGLLGPLVAAFAVTALTRGSKGIADLFARMARWRVSFRWYLVAVSPLAFFAVAAAVVAASGRGWPALHDLGLFGGLPAIGALGVWATLTIVNGFGEETGWRGFATPQLRRSRSLLKASLILAVFWAAWHTPTFFLLQRYRDLGAAVLPGFILGIFAGAIFLTWLYERSGNSILIVTLWHGTYNLTSGTVAASKHTAIAATVSTAVMIWAGFIAIAELRSARRTRAAHGHRMTAPKRWNSFVSGILRSPLHGMLSRWLVVVTVRGRKSGREYKFPVGYVEDEGLIYLLVAEYEQKNWWRNVESARHVVLTLRGRSVLASGEVLHFDRDPRAATAAFARYCAHQPRVARVLGVTRLDAPDEVAAGAKKILMVRVRAGRPALRMTA